MEKIPGIQIESSMRRSGEYSIGETVCQLVRQIQDFMHGDYDVEIPDWPAEDEIWERRFNSCSRVILQFHPRRLGEREIRSELLVTAVNDLDRGPTSRIFDHSITVDPMRMDGPLAKEDYADLARDLTTTLARLYWDRSRFMRTRQEIYRAPLVHDPLHVEPIYRQGSEQSLSAALTKVLGQPSLTIELTDDYLSIYHVSDQGEPVGYRLVIGDYDPEHGAETLRVIDRL